MLTPLKISIHLNVLDDKNAKGNISGSIKTNSNAKNGEKNRQIKSELISSWACVGAFVGYFLLNNSFADHVAWANYRMSDKAYDSFCQTGDFILKLYLMFYQKHSRTRCRKCIHEQNFA